MHLAVSLDTGDSTLSPLLSHPCFVPLDPRALAGRPSRSAAYLAAARCIFASGALPWTVILAAVSGIQSSEEIKG